MIQAPSLRIGSAERGRNIVLVQFTTGKMEKIFLLIFLTITTISSSPINTKTVAVTPKSTDYFCLNILNFNNAYYSLDEQIQVTGIPADMTMHWKTGNMFFTIISEEFKMSLHILHPSGNIESIPISGLGQSTYIDNLNDIIYLATDSGVYKYKYDGSLDLHTASGEDVMYIAGNRDGSALYIATWPQNRVHKIMNNGRKHEMFPAVPNGHGLTVDSKDNIYFVATKTMYILKSSNYVPIRIKGLSMDKMSGVFISKTNEVYAMDENSNFYKIDPETASATLLGSFSVNGVNSFALDGDNNVYIGVKGKILKFNLYENNPCPELEKKKKIRHKRKRKTKRRTTTSTERSDEDDDEDLEIRVVNASAEKI